MCALACSSSSSSNCRCAKISSPTVSQRANRNFSMTSSEVWRLGGGVRLAGRRECFDVETFGLAQSVRRPALAITSALDLRAGGNLKEAHWSVLNWWLCSMQRCLRPLPRNINAKAFGLTRTHRYRLGGHHCLRRRLLGNYRRLCRLGGLAFIDLVSNGDLDLLWVIGE